MITFLLRLVVLDNLTSDDVIFGTNLYIYFDFFYSLERYLFFLYNFLSLSKATSFYYVDEILYYFLPSEEVKRFITIEGLQPLLPEKLGDFWQMAF